MKVPSNDDWTAQQFEACELGNALRTKRLKKVADAMLRCPEASLPKQNREWADLKAAYRLFECPAVTYSAVASVHWDRTRQTKPGRYLLISDTTDVDHTRRRATKGLGMLGNGGGRGIQLHNCLVYNATTEQIAGLAGGLPYYRSLARKGETRGERLARGRESEIWGQLVSKIGKPPSGSQWIHVFDRGGDNFEAFCHIQINQCEWIIRAAKLQRNVVLESGETVSLGKAIKSKKHLGSYELKLRSRQGVKARTATMNVFVLTVTLPRPHMVSKWTRDCGIEEIRTNIVIVEEANPRKGAKPIHWILFSSLPAGTFEEAQQVVEDYQKRWLIEEYNKAAKTGCSLEAHALRSADRLEPLLALISVVAVRLFQMKLLGRSQKEAKARTHVPSEWLAVLKKMTPKLKLAGLTVYEFFRELAKHGGFLARKSDGEPGWQTIWYGFKRLQTTLEAFELLKEK